MTSLREKIVKDLERRNLISANQMTQAYITMYAATDESNSYAICRLILQGIGAVNQADVITVTVEVDGDVVKTADVTIHSGDLREFDVTLPEDIVRKHNGGKAICTVAVQDTYYRTLAVSTGDVLFSHPDKAPEWSSKVVFAGVVDCNVDSSKVKVADVLITPGTDGPVSIDVYESNAVVWHDTVHAKTGVSVSREIRVMKDALEAPTAIIRILVRSGGATIIDESRSVEVTPRRTEPCNEAAVGECAPMVDGDLRIVDFVDIQESTDGISKLGEVIISNREENKPLNLMVSLTLDGRDIYESISTISPGKKRIPVDVPVDTIADDDAHNVELTLVVCEPNGRKLALRTATIPVKSKFDMNLGKLEDRVPKYVNPRDRVVSSVIQDTAGGLARAMGNPYVICGYQNGGSQILRMIDGLYRFIRDSDMKYVCDTFTIDFSSDSSCYQRVKSAARTYETRNGNCLELSILFASFIEAMGLEPVILFPPGHAMVGVVLATNIYDTESDISKESLERMDNAVKMTIGDRVAIVLPIEATMCAHGESSLSDASSCAVETIKRVSEDMNFLFIHPSRTVLGIYPMPGL